MVLTPERRLNLKVNYVLIFLHNEINEIIIKYKPPGGMMTIE